jgi:hypothetical protein
MPYLLDTTVLIDHARGVAGAPELLAELFGQPDDLLVCDVVVAEALSKGSDTEVVVIGTLVRALEYVAAHPEAPAGPGRRVAGASRPAHDRWPTRSSPASRRISVRLS